MIYRQTAGFFNHYTCEDHELWEVDGKYRWLTFTEGSDVAVEQCGGDYVRKAFEEARRAYLDKERCCRN